MHKLLLSSFVLASLVACTEKAPEAPVGSTTTAAAADGHGEHGHGEAHGDHHAAAAPAADNPQAAQKAERERVDADGVVRRGAKLSEGAALTVSEAAAKAKELDGKVVKVAGTVESVCQPMGCWFVIKGATPAENIRVMSKGHDVFMPKSSAGRDVVAEGELKVKTVSKDMAQHMEDERELKAGEQRTVFTGDVQELSLTLNAAELQPVKS